MGVIDTFLRGTDTSNTVKKVRKYFHGDLRRYSVDMERLSEPFLKGIIKERYQGKDYREAMTRLDKELHDLENMDDKGTWKGYYYLMMLIDEIANDYTYPYFFRDKETGTFISYLLGLTHLNPLSKSAGGCEIPYIGKAIDSLTISAVPVLIHIIPDIMCQMDNISVISEEYSPYTVKIRLGLNGREGEYEITLAAWNVLANIWNGEHMDLGENFEDVEWEKTEDPYIFLKAANMFIQYRNSEGHEDTYVEKMESAIKQSPPVSFCDLIDMLSIAHTFDDLNYAWPRKPLAEIARTFCILATIDKKRNS